MKRIFQSMILPLLALMVSMTAKAADVQQITFGEPMSYTGFKAWYGAFTLDEAAQVSIDISDIQDYNSFGVYSDSELSNQFKNTEGLVSGQGTFDLEAGTYYVIATFPWGSGTITVTKLAAAPVSAAQVTYWENFGTSNSIVQLDNVTQGSKYSLADGEAQLYKDGELVGSYGIDIWAYSEPQGIRIWDLTYPTESGSYKLVFPEGIVTLNGTTLGEVFYEVDVEGESEPVVENWTYTIDPADGSTMATLSSFVLTVTKQGANYIGRGTNGAQGVAIYDADGNVVEYAAINKQAASPFTAEMTEIIEPGTYTLKLQPQSLMDGQTYAYVPAEEIELGTYTVTGIATSTVTSVPAAGASVYGPVTSIAVTYSDLSEITKVAGAQVTIGVTKYDFTVAGNVLTVEGLELNPASATSYTLIIPRSALMSGDKNVQEQKITFTVEPAPNFTQWTLKGTETGVVSGDYDNGWSIATTIIGMEPTMFNDEKCYIEFPNATAATWTNGAAYANYYYGTYSDTGKKHLFSTADEGVYLSNLQYLRNMFSKKAGFEAGNTYAITVTIPANSFKLTGTDGNEYDNEEMTFTVNVTTLPVVTLTPAEATIQVGETTEISVAVAPETKDQTVTWTSSDENVATVNAGVVTAVTEGTATITATTTSAYSGSNSVLYSGTCEITVAAAAPAENPFAFKPEEGTYESISEVIIASAEGTTAEIKDYDARATVVGPEGTAEYGLTLGTGYNEIVIDKLSLTESGTYTISVPAGAIQVENGDANLAMTITYTIEAPAPAENPFAFKPEEGTYESISEVIIASAEGTEAEIKNYDARATVVGPEGTAEYGLTLGTGYNEIVIDKLSLTESGTYTISVPAGAVGIVEGDANLAMTITYTIEAPAEPEPMVVTFEFDPASGSVVEEIKEIKMTKWTGLTSSAWFLNFDEATLTVNGVATAATIGYDWDKWANYIVLDNAITEAGEYTLTVSGLRETDNTNYHAIADVEIVYTIEAAEEEGRAISCTFTPASGSTVTELDVIGMSEFAGLTEGWSPNFDNAYALLNGEPVAALVGFYGGQFAVDLEEPITEPGEYTITVCGVRQYDWGSTYEACSNLTATYTVAAPKKTLDDLLEIASVAPGVNQNWNYTADDYFSIVFNTDPSIDPIPFTVTYLGDANNAAEIVMDLTEICSGTTMNGLGWGIYKQKVTPANLQALWYNGNYRITIPEDGIPGYQELTWEFSATGLQTYDPNAGLPTPEVTSFSQFGTSGNYIMQLNGVTDGGKYAFVAGTQASIYLNGELKQTCSMRVWDLAEPYGLQIFGPSFTEVDADYTIVIPARTVTLDNVLQGEIRYVYTTKEPAEPITLTSVEPALNDDGTINLYTDQDTQVTFTYSGEVGQSMTTVYLYTSALSTESAAFVKYEPEFTRNGNQITFTIASSVKSQFGSNATALCVVATNADGVLADGNMDSMGKVGHHYTVNWTAKPVTTPVIVMLTEKYADGAEIAGLPAANFNSTSDQDDGIYWVTVENYDNPESLSWTVTYTCNNTSSNMADWVWDAANTYKHMWDWVDDHYVIYFPPYAGKVENGDLVTATITAKSGSEVVATATFKWIVKAATTTLSYEDLTYDPTQVEAGVTFTVTSPEPLSSLVIYGKAVTADKEVKWAPCYFYVSKADDEGKVWTVNTSIAMSPRLNPDGTDYDGTGKEYATAYWDALAANGATELVILVNAKDANGATLLGADASGIYSTSLAFANADAYCDLAVDPAAGDVDALSTFTFTTTDGNEVGIDWNCFTEGFAPYIKDADGNTVYTFVSGDVNEENNYILTIGDATVIEGGKTYTLVVPAGVYLYEADDYLNKPNNAFEAVYNVAAEPVSGEYNVAITEIEGRLVSFQKREGTDNEYDLVVNLTSDEMAASNTTYYSQPLLITPVDADGVMSLSNGKTNGTCTISYYEGEDISGDYVISSASHRMALADNTAKTAISYATTGRMNYSRHFTAVLPEGWALVNDIAVPQLLVHVFVKVDGEDPVDNPFAFKPEEGTYETISEVIIASAEGTEAEILDYDARATVVGPEGTAEYGLTLGVGYNEIVIDKLSLTMYGTYTITVPAGAVGVVGGAANTAMTITYMIDNDNLPVYDVTLFEKWGASSNYVIQLNDITDVSKYEVVNGTKASIYIGDELVQSNVNVRVWDIQDPKGLMIYDPNFSDVNATYTIVIPAKTVTVDGVLQGEIRYDYSAKPKAEPITFVSIEPAADTEGNLQLSNDQDTTITVTYSGEIGNSMTTAFLYTSALSTEDLNFNKVVLPYTLKGEKMIITVTPAIAEQFAGKATAITIVAANTDGEVAEGNMEDQGKQGHTFNVNWASASGIVEILTDGADTVTVYGLNGQMYLHNAPAAAVSSLEAGYYIINGKKVFIRK